MLYSRKLQALCTKQRALSSLGFSLSIFGFLLALLWSKIFDKLLYVNLALTSNSFSFDKWEVTPVPVYIEFYFFNWTNKDDLRNASTKPILQELGPYVFRERIRRIVDRWNPENGTVSFRQNRTWHFEPSMSTGGLDDMITTVNIPAASAEYASRILDPFTRTMANEVLEGLDTEYYMTGKVREYLFDGLDDPLIHVRSMIPDGLFPFDLPFDRFGWFYTRNGSADYDGVFNMRTGVGDITRFGELTEWNYSNRSHAFQSHCGSLNGSAGELFPPNRDKTSVSHFSYEICRSLRLNFKEEVEVDGIPGYRFWGDESMFDNDNPDNWCFCTTGKCAPNGVLDMSTCKWGTPTYVSSPHFYHADPSYREAIVGMDPHEEKHQMFIDLEPQTGIPLRGSVALQINVLVEPHEGFSLFKDVPKVYFPIMWFKQSAMIDDVIGPELNFVAVILPKLGTAFAFLMLGSGLAILLHLVVKYLQTDSDKKSLNKNPDLLHEFDHLAP